MSAEALEEERDMLRRELRGTQEMLGQVLLAIGEPVSVSKESLKNGVGEGMSILIDDHDDFFVFSLGVADD
jgi:hypothetical protein